MISDPLGRINAWNTAREPSYGMSYFTRADLAYYYTLYDNFLVGDQYYQSTFTQTNPNRLHFFSGSNGLSIGEQAVLDNTEPKPGFNWTTIAEILEEKNISWKVYQEFDNFDDNAFQWFSKFQQSRPGDPLFDKGMIRYPSAIKEFSEDVTADVLPQVSWIIAPTSKSEHATNHPAAGEDFTANVLKVLEENPDVYKKTVFILNYDEGGQFFDHGYPFTPPMSANEGISTVSVEGEINTEVMTTEPAPIGLGFRVPLLIISPWTRGNLVLSEVLDHTSIIQFLEHKFDVECPNISPWRRAITGDLLNAFDWDSPDYSWPSDLPNTSDYVKDAWVECVSLPDPKIPEIQSMPTQEPGTRVSRSLPYEFVVTDRLKENIMNLVISNTGTGDAPFVSFDVNNLDTVEPLKYAVESAKEISQDLSIFGDGQYNFHLQGPNGFVRNFFGNTDDESCKSVESYVSYIPDQSLIEIHLDNMAATNVTFTINDNAYKSFTMQNITVAGGASTSLTFDISNSGHWYDVSITLSSCYLRRSMGRMEVGKDTISDPAMAAGISGLWTRDTDNDEINHPQLRESLRTFERKETKCSLMDKDARF